MKNNKKILIAGGDYRQTYLAAYLLKYFEKVYTLGFTLAKKYEGAVVLNDISELSEPLDILILPPVATNDGKTVNTPFFDCEVLLTDVLNKLKPGAWVFGGNLKDDLLSEIDFRGLCAYDYFGDEELTLLNTVPTAEGALKIALEETPFVLSGAKVSVLGYGRVGETVAKLFKAVGADVLVFDRKSLKRTRAQIDGLAACEFNDERIKKSDIIINTVPVLVLDKEKLKKIKRDTVIIDLASKPGGVDLSYAKLRGMNVIWALSLPGKSAPVTSGEIIAKTILSKLSTGGDLLG